MFLLNEKVVYPGYGVALISRKVERVVAGAITTFFELKFFTKDMTILVPENRLESVGIRRLSTEQDILDMIDLLQGRVCKKVAATCDSGVVNWNKRNKDYQFKLRSGDIIKISTIYKDLQNVGYDKELSFGERNLLSQIENLLVEEISVVLCLSKEEALQKLRTPFLSTQTSTTPGIQSKVTQVAI